MSFLYSNCGFKGSCEEYVRFCTCANALIEQEKTSPLFSPSLGEYPSSFKIRGILIKTATFKTWNRSPRTLKRLEKWELRCKWPFPVQFLLLKDCRRLQQSICKLYWIFSTFLSALISHFHLRSTGNASNCGSKGKSAELFGFKFNNLRLNRYARLSQQPKTLQIRARQNF